MAFASTDTYFDEKATIIGSFREKDFDNLFEFSVNDDINEAFAEYPHKIWVSNDANPPGGMRPYRYGTVKKSVAYLCVDEDEFGLPVVEKWSIKGYNKYLNNN